MHKVTGVISFVVAMLVVLAVFPAQEAKAYIDPGTGSLVMQSASAGLLMALLSLRTLVSRIKLTFNRR
jgi:hypothetical protein